MLRIVAGSLVVILLLLVIADAECCPDGCTTHGTLAASTRTGSPDAPHACFLCAAGVEPVLIEAPRASLALVGRCASPVTPMPPSITTRPLDHPPKTA